MRHVWAMLFWITDFTTCAILTYHYFLYLSLLTRATKASVKAKLFDTLSVVIKENYQDVNQSSTDTLVILTNSKKKINQPNTSILRIRLV